MRDRGMIKWMPFNSVVNTKYIVNSIEKEKRKISKPILSEEQIAEIENNILESFINKVPLSFKIYQGGYIFEFIDIVTNIDSAKKIIILNNHKKIYFREIISALNNQLC